MVQSEQRGLTRRQGACGCGSRGAAKRGGSWAVAVVALLVMAVVIATAGCGSGTQASPSTTASFTRAGQTGGAQTGTGQSLPSGAPTGAPPSGAQGGPTSSTDSAATTTTTIAAVGSTTTTQAATTTTSLASGQHGDGLYEAGVDISTGLYKGKAVGADAHWEISSDANGDKYVAGGDPTGQFYLNVTWGQYLRLSGAIIQKASYTPADPLATKKLTNGTYRAGYDIAVGRYSGTVTAGEGTMGYWQISSDANGQTLVGNDYPLGPFTLTVTWGQYLTLRGVTVSQ